MHAPEAESARRPRRRVALVTSHPIQYHAPWFRGLAARCDLRVYFAHRQSASDQAEAGYGVAFEWDTDLTSGYPHAFLANVAQRPNVYDFAGCDTPELESEIARGGYDAVIVTGWYLKSYWQAAIAAKRARLPVLVRGDSQLRTPRTGLKRLVQEFSHRWLLQQFDGFLAPGTRNREYLRHFGARDEQIAFVPHFIDDTFFRERAERARPGREALRAAWGVTPNDTVALYVGRFIPIKRPLDLLYATQRLRRTGVPVTAVFVGAGPLANELTASEAAREARPVVLGFHNQGELPAVYAAADVVVLPGFETWGLVVNEAMSCGVPAVVSDAAGCAPDLITDGVTGYSYRAGDVGALAAAIAAARTLQRTRELAGALRAKTAEFSCERAVEGTLEAVEAALARKR